MADVTKVRQHGNGHQPAEMLPTPAHVDPRAVRVRLASTSRLADEAAVLIAPARSPLRMTNPSVGSGPLGGTLSLAPDDPGDHTVVAQRHPSVDGVTRPVSLDRFGGGRAVLREGEPKDGPALRIARVVLEPGVQEEGGLLRREVLVDGFRFDVEIEPERIAALRERASRGRAASAHSGPLQVKAIIPGKVVAVSIAAGDAVTAGQQMLVVEAMKMQNELRSPRDGTIDRVGVATGDNIEVGDLLVVIT